MPGLRPDLLQEFLADGNLGTQPERPLADRTLMVQPVPGVAASGRPEGALQGPRSRSATAGNCTQFSAHLRRPAELAGGPPRSAQKAAEPVVDPEYRGHEMSPRPDLSASLAPEEQPSLAAGRGELAEWLWLINPSDGMEPPPLVAPAPPVPQAAVAAVADLVERWVRRVALGGDQRRGAVRLDIGQGRFAGAELLVVAERGRVSVELSLPPAVADADLSARLQSRLERRGYEADVVVRQSALAVEPA
jgi:hypothetical protein